MPEEEFKSENDETEYEQKKAYAVDAMHVFDKRCFRPVGIWFSKVEILCYLL